MKRTPPEICDYIAEIYKGRRRREIARMVNEKFGTNYNAASIGSHLKNRGMKTGISKGRLPGEVPKLFSPEMEAFVRANCAGRTHQEMADLVNAEFGTSFTVMQIKGFYSRAKINSGLTGHFEKGMVPKNKGKTWDEFLSPEAQERSRQTQFKKGQMPHNYRPIGHERITRDGYTEVKVRERITGKYSDRNYALKHRLVYEENFGPIPEGYIVSFRDGNKQNLDPDNLFLITRAQNAVMNHRDLRPENPEYAESAAILADLILATTEKKKQQKKVKRKTCKSE